MTEAEEYKKRASLACEISGTEDWNNRFRNKLAELGLALTTKIIRSSRYPDNAPYNAPHPYAESPNPYPKESFMVWADE